MEGRVAQPKQTVTHYFQSVKKKKKTKIGSFTMPLGKINGCINKWMDKWIDEQMCKEMNEWEINR